MRDGGRAEAFFENQSRMPWRGAGAFLAQLGRWIVPSAQKGLAGPQLASVLQVKYDTTGGKRCANARPRPAHQPAPLHKSQPIPLADPRSVVYAAQTVSPPLAAPESNLGDRSISSGT